MSNIFITGANRGIGLGFVRHYLSHGHNVLACYRSNTKSSFPLDDPACHWLKWDVLHALGPAQRTQLPDEIHLLINNAGIYGSKGDKQDLLNITQTELTDVFQINAASPIHVVQTLLPRLRKGKATIANISSKMGSIADNTSGGVYAYRAAKSALCHITKSMALDLAGDNIQAISLHPGWVKTDMTNQTGLIDIKTSVAGLAEVIDNISQYPPGAFVAYDGAIVPY